MKAVVYTRYGSPDALQVMEMPKPALRENEVLLRVHAASVNALDYRRFVSASLVGRFMDEVLIKAVGKVLGADVAGRVEAVGEAVTRWRPGDEVFGVCPGAFAEYARASEKSVALKPSNLSFADAAAAPVAAVTALQALRDWGRLKAGQNTLIYGASGGVGTFAVQIAKAFGAKVTAVCSARNLDRVRSLGADHVADYAREDFARQPQRYDLIVAVNGSRRIWDYGRALNPEGTYVAVGGAISQVFEALLLGPALSRLGRKKMLFMGIAKTRQEDLRHLSELLEAGHIRPVIDRRFPLPHTAEAMRYLAGGHARGKVVIEVE